MRMPTRYNVLILPGDLTEVEANLKRTLQMFSSAFDLVCFTPGNHDLWVTSREAPDSMRKLRQVMKVCGECRVRTGPVWLRCSGSGIDNDVVLMPLLSWYTSEWDKEPDLPWVPSEHADTSIGAWMDFWKIRWPGELVVEIQKRGQRFSFDGRGTAPGLSEIFGAANESWLAEMLPRLLNGQRPAAVISYSHFLPRQDLLPEKRFLFYSFLHKVSGSHVLEGQVRRFRPDVHVCGHTHMPFDVEVDGQRYVQWSLGNPSEQRAQTRVVSSSGILVLYDGCAALPHKRFPPWQYTFWGEYFHKSGRAPNEFCPAPWVRRHFKNMRFEFDIPYSDEDYQRTPQPVEAPSAETTDAQWRI